MREDGPGSIGARDSVSTNLKGDFKTQVNFMKHQNNEPWFPLPEDSMAIGDFVKFTTKTPTKNFENYPGSAGYIGEQFENTELGRLQNLLTSGRKTTLQDLEDVSNLRGQVVHNFNKLEKLEKAGLKDSEEYLEIEATNAEILDMLEQVEPYTNTLIDKLKAKEMNPTNK